MTAPFFYYSSSFPEFLFQNNLSIILSTYQAGKVIVVGSTNGKSLELYAKNFQRPMGIASVGDQLAIASKSKIDLFSTSPALAYNFPEKKGHFDKVFLPQVTYYTGMADIHEIEWGNEGLWAVNTAFSCLCLMDEKYSFIPKWKPSFISELLPEDRCHLNGLAMKDGKPSFVTMFDSTNAADGWRNGNTETGLIVEVDSHRILADHLPMPHSPLLDGQKLYYLLSASGQVMELDIESGLSRNITILNNFLRGLYIFDDYLIIAASELRESSKSFSNMDIRNKENPAGVYIIDKTTGKEFAKLTFTKFIKEIFSVKIIPNTIRAAIITEKEEIANRFIHAPDKLDFWAKQL